MNEQTVLNFIYTTLKTNLETGFTNQNLTVEVAQGYQITSPKKGVDGLLLFHLDSLTNKGFQFQSYEMIGLDNIQVDNQYRIASIQITTVVSDTAVDNAYLASLAVQILQSVAFREMLLTENVGLHRAGNTSINYFLNQFDEYQASVSFNVEMSYLINLNYNVTNADNFEIMTNPI